MQVIVEAAELGEMNHIKHPLDLFVNFMATSVRLLVIMLQHAGRKEEKPTVGQE